MMEIVLLLLGIIAIIVWKSNVSRENSTQRSNGTTGTITLISKIDYLLEQVDGWETDQLIDSTTATKLRKQYQLERQKILGYTPGNVYPVESIKSSNDFFSSESINPSNDTCSRDSMSSSDETCPAELINSSGEMYSSDINNSLDVMHSADSTPPRPSKPTFDLMNFLKEKNIKWFNALGTLMLLASGIIFVATSWDSWNGGLKSLTMVCTTVLFYLGGYFLKNKLDLTNSGFAFYLVGSLFVPLDMIAFNNFALFGETFDWSAYSAIAALLTSLLYSYMVYRHRSQVFTGLAACMGGASLYALLSYLEVKYSLTGLYFVPLSLVYFLLYYYLIKVASSYRQVLAPLPIVANLFAACGLGFSAIDQLSFSLLATALMAAITYLSATYLFKRLEYLYVFMGLLVLSVFPGVDYYHLPDSAYNLGFLTITGISLGFSYLNRRLRDKALEQNFFYAMLGLSALTGFFVLFGQIQLLNTELYHHPEVGGAALTLLGGSIIYLISAWLYQKPRYTYVAIVAIATGYSLGLMWLGTSGKLYGFCYLLLAITLLIISKLTRHTPLWSLPAYQCGLILNSLVTLLLTMLLANHPAIFVELNLNLLLATLALVLNSAVYYYLAWERKHGLFVYIGNGVFSFAYLLLAVYLGLSFGQFGFYTVGLSVIFLSAQRFCGRWTLFAIPMTITGMIAIFVPIVMDLSWLFISFERQLMWSNVPLFNRFNVDMIWVIGTFCLVPTICLYIMKRFKNSNYLYVTTGLLYINALLFYNWLGLEPSSSFSLLMVVVLIYLALYKALQNRPSVQTPLLISVVGANLLTTLLLITGVNPEGTPAYLTCSLALICNAGVYLYLAYIKQQAAYTWASLVPLGYLYLISLWQFEIDPAWLYIGLKLMMFAYLLVGMGLACLRKGWPFYWKPLFATGYVLSAIALLLALSHPATLISPALMATALYGVTTWFAPNYQNRFWQATLLAANISFGALIYLIDPHYSLLTYVKYFVVFNLLKLNLGIYFQKFKGNAELANSNYAGVILTSLGSLLITAIWGDLQSGALTWTVYGLVYFLLAWLLNQPTITYVSSAVLTTGLAFTLAYIGIPNSHVGLYLASLPFLWLTLKVQLRHHPVYKNTLFYVIPVSTALFFVHNLGYDLDTTILGSILAGAALLTHGKLEKIELYDFVAPIVLIVGYEACLLKYEVTFQELYVAPISLYLIIISFYLRKWAPQLNYLSYFGIISFMLVSYMHSWSGADHLIHALVLGLSCVVSILIGVAFKHKGFFFLGIIFLLGDVSTQTRSLFMSIQKWFWIGLGGALFLTLGVLFDKKRQDRTLQSINNQVQRFSGWH